MPKLKPGHISPTEQEDAAINRGIAADPENPEWAKEDFSHARVMKAGKVSVTIRLDAEVIDAAKAQAAQQGMGYQTLINDLLRRALAAGSAPLTESALRRILREELHHI
ncbi:phage protein [Bordetella ansorpii]|uniref:Phage protein n=1 Tax=Bordetella ansorpii TaxID=288768 RepID=A0A157RQI0_9BORD|nr:BrnA antitoxin family protein [Bordetella ansorpii]SAI59669.1 phage protein [Bordetella ansorpii]